MKKSSSRSLLMWPILATCLTLSAFGQQPSLETNDASGRAPVASYTPGSRAPILTKDASGNVVSGNYWDSLASTDYYNVAPYILQPPNPDIAVGPSDILVTVNRVIARYPNPNAAGAAAVTQPWSKPPLQPGYQPTSKVFLDAWLGEANLNAACPTQPRSNDTCVIDNVSVRYDQLQGRFLVFFTIVDTGTPGNLNSTRLAHWVLLASRWADFGTKYGSTGTTEVFSTPQPPGPNQDNPSSGGVNTNWYAYLGSATNINLIKQSLIDRTTADNMNNGGVTAPIDCTLGAVPQPGTAPTSVCYIPTAARLGIDNDNLIITASVINDNIPVADRSLNNPAYAGTRLRVYKKNTIYRGVAITSANAGDEVAALQGDYYDLYPITPTPGQSTFANDRYRANPYTVDPHLIGLFYEPEHVRGRSLATYTGNANIGDCRGIPTNQYNCLAPNGNAAGVINLVGTDSRDAGPTNSASATLYLRSIIYSRQFPGVPSVAATNPPTPSNGTSIAGGVPTLIGDPGCVRCSWPEALTVPFFSNPALVAQHAKLNGDASPSLYVGDARPHRVIMREGQLYVARVGNTTIFGSNSNFDRSQLNSTVIYDVVQKLNWRTNATSILNTKWVNGRYFQPMFDVTPNVIQYGSVSPISLVSYLDKLFVGTTFPPLSPTDPRTPANNGMSPYLTAKQSSICKGQEPGVTLPANPPLPTNQPVPELFAFPSMFDVRCGEDGYDTQQTLRNAVTGATFNTLNGAPVVPWGIRGGASIDPNNGTLWIYGSYGAGRLSTIPGAGQWGTHVANYDMTFAPKDMYGNDTINYPDVTDQTYPFFRYIQIAKQTDVAPGGRTSTGNFDPNGLVTRAEMAAWVIRAQMDSTAIENYLLATGGNYSSFADVPVNNDPVKSTDKTHQKYIEVMYRRGYTKGCSGTIDTVRQFCPSANLTRGQMAVFLVRAKMNSVFPTVVSGLYNGGDLFGLSISDVPYFTDVPKTHDFFPYIQKMRELRISNGTAAGSYTPESNITRGEITAFIIRAFFN